MKNKIQVFIAFLILTLPCIAVCETINLKWSHSNPEAVQGYRLYVKKYPNENFIMEWEGHENKHSYETVVGNKYGFAVTAFNEFGESLKSQEVIYTSEDNMVDPITILNRPSAITITFE
jgi:hypothetical protein